MSRGIDFDSLWQRALPLLAAGPVSGQDLARLLRVSQPTLSRLLARHPQLVLSVGRARATRYVLRRVLHDLGQAMPIYDVDDQGAASQLAVLHPIGERGFFVESRSALVDEGVYRDLPYFLDGLRPSGFLGRLVPRQHADLGLPSDIRLWSADHALRYLTRFGWNAVGNLIVGDEAFGRYVQHNDTPQPAISLAQRSRRYAKLARDVLAGAPPGSSAAGEQPKFLARRAPGVEVLVKFSPPLAEPVGRRIADLLVAEHLAHEAVRNAGLVAAQSDIVASNDQLFLEVERFDRTSQGRRGVLSLEALDAEFAGVASPGGWTVSVRELALGGHIPPDVVDRVRWLDLFGALIANSDMHPANLSFFVQGQRVLGLAPAYDMLPMRYAPLHGHLPELVYRPPLPTPPVADVWDDVCRAAAQFWCAVAQHPLISSAFRSAAREHQRSVERLRAMGQRLPR